MSSFDFLCHCMSVGEVSTGLNPGGSQAFRPFRGVPRYPSHLVMRKSEPKPIMASGFLLRAHAQVVF